MKYAVSVCALIIGLTGCQFNPSYHHGFPGPWPTEKIEVATPFYGHDVEFTVYYPVADSVPTPLPLIVFNSGWNQPRSTNDAYCTQLAQWGSVVINRQYPSFVVNTLIERQIEHNTVVIDWAIAQNADPASPLFGYVDDRRIGVLGYSLGAAAALMAPLWDNRVGACVAIDALPRNEYDLGSVDYVKDLTVPAMFIRSGVPSIMGAPLSLFEHAPPPALDVVIEGASHMQFEDHIVGLNILGKLIFPGAEADPLVTRGLATKYIVAWFKVFLENDLSFMDYLDGPYSAEDEANGLVTIGRKFSIDTTQI
jgi:dienelactone hydrolase